MFAKIPNSQCFSVQRVVVVRPSLLGARGTLLAQIPTGKLPIRSLSFFFYHWWDPAGCRHGVRGTLLAQWELAHPFASLVVAHPFVLWATCHSGSQWQGSGKFSVGKQSMGTCLPVCFPSCSILMLPSILSSLLGSFYWYQKHIASLSLSWS